MGDCELKSSAGSALIVAYRRHQNLARLISLCVKRDMSPIYVSLDGPPSINEKNETDECRRVVREMQAQYPGRIRERISNANLGAAHSVLAAVTWAFQTEDFLIVIEDDCIPNDEFFDFVQLGKKFLEKSDDCYIICGTQFAPVSVTFSTWALSSYPLIWGWATSRDKWQSILGLLAKYENSNRFSGHGSLSERSFWHSGAMRSYKGFVDAWDLPLVNALRHVGGLALLPGENLVTNIGNDGFATHTVESSQWLNLSTGKVNFSESEPAKNPELDNWLKNNFYRIRPRHLVTNKLTALLDLIGFHKKKRPPLISRIFNT